MPGLEVTLSKIRDGKTVTLDPSESWTMSSDISISADGWTVDGQGAHVDVSGGDIHLDGDNWTFRGFFLDSRGARCQQVKIVTGDNSGGWTLERLGWPDIIGECSGDTKAQALSLGTRQGTTNHLRNIYVGSGGTDGAVIQQSNNRHQGTIEAENIHIRKAADNGIYGVSSHDGWCNQGIWHIRDSHFAHNCISDVRIGTEEGWSTVGNCSFINTLDKRPVNTNGFHNARGVWAYFGKVEVTNCQFYLEDGGGDMDWAEPIISKRGDDCPPREVRQSGNQVYDSPAQVDIPGGVPMSPKEAAGAEPKRARLHLEANQQETDYPITASTQYAPSRQKRRRADPNC